MRSEKTGAWRIALVWLACVLAGWAIVAFIVWLAFPIFGVSL